MTLARVIGLSHFTRVELDADGNVERRLETPRGETVDVGDHDLERGLSRGWLELVDEAVAAVETAAAPIVTEAIQDLASLAARELVEIANSLGIAVSAKVKKADLVAAITAAQTAQAAVEPEPAVASDGLDDLSDDDLLERSLDLDVEPGADRDATIAALREKLAAPVAPAADGA